MALSNSLIDLVTRPAAKTKGLDQKLYDMLKTIRTQLIGVVVTTKTVISWTFIHQTNQPVVHCLSPLQHVTYKTLWHPPIVVGHHRNCD